MKQIAIFCIQFALLTLGFSQEGDSLQRITSPKETLAWDAIDIPLKQSIHPSYAEPIEDEVDANKTEAAGGKQETWLLYVLGITLIVVGFFGGLLIKRLKIIRSQKEISELQRLKAIEQKKEAEKSEKFKQQFLANMSHEIRTPMNAITGLTHLVLETEITDKQRFYLERIQQAGENLLYIINDILDLSKVEAGKMELEAIDFSLRDVVTQVEEILRHKSDEKNLALLTKVESDVSTIVIGDPVRLTQVLINLVGNGIKFTERGSVQLSLSNSDEGVLFRITDTGIGIQESKLKRIFSSFSQASSSDTRKYGGTGLGLSISKELVDLMGGSIGVESTPNVGTTFYFTVPFEMGSEKRLIERKEKEKDIDGTILDGVKILLVDDNEFNRIVATDTLLANADVSIIEAVDGREAIEKLIQNEVDIVLMDVQMPEMSGLEATRYIREKCEEPKKSIPIVAVTASILKDDINRCIESGMDSYVSKPFKPQQLISAIATTLDIPIRRKESKNILAKEEDKDLKTITQLDFLTEFCRGDMNKAENYVRLYIKSATGLQDVLQAHLTEKDYERIASIVHSFKTKWTMMGMDNTVLIAHRLEEECRGEEPSFDKVKKELDAIVSDVNTSLKELSIKST